MLTAVQALNSGLLKVDDPVAPVSPEEQGVLGPANQALSPATLPQTRC